MSYFWLGRDSYEVEARIEANRIRSELEQDARNALTSIFEAYGYEEPQARTEGNNLTDRNSSNGSTESACIRTEADGFVTVHPKVR